MMAPMAARARYEITVAGHLGTELAGALDLVVAVDGDGHTVLRGELDQPALYGVLRRIGDLGLELRRFPVNRMTIRIPARRVRSRPRDGAGVRGDVTGRLPLDAVKRFGEVDVRPQGEITVLRGALDQAGLQGLLGWLELESLELVDVRLLEPVAG